MTAEPEATPSMRCFGCDRVLSELGEYEVPATTWYSYGNYGSTLYDNLASTQRLELYVCDGCLGQRAASVRTVRLRPVRQQNQYLPGIVTEE